MANKNYRPVLSFGLRTVLISLVLLVLLVGLNIAASLLPLIRRIKIYFHAFVYNRAEVVGDRRTGHGLLSLQ